VALLVALERLDGIQEQARELADLLHPGCPLPDALAQHARRVLISIDAELARLLRRVEAAGPG
jgi:hypothetical protein